MDEERGRAAARGLRHAREIEGHLDWLDSFTGTALGVLSVASGIYTYLGVSTRLDDTGALSVFAAMAYSIAVSVGICVFWSYMLRLLPAMRSAGSSRPEPPSRRCPGAGTRWAGASVRRPGWSSGCTWPTAAPWSSTADRRWTGR